MSSPVLNQYSIYLQAEKGMADTSRASYLKAARDCIALLRDHPRDYFLAEDWDWHDVDKRALEIYLLQLREVKGWKPASVRHQASALRAFFAFLQARGHIARNPLRSFHPYSREEAGPLPEGEEQAVRKLFSGAADNLDGARLLAVLELIYGGGLRPSLVYGMSGLQVLKRLGLARITAGESSLDVPLSQAGLERLSNYRKMRRAVVGAGGQGPFWVDRRGRPASPARLARAVARAMEAAQLSGGGRVLRQLSARHFRERGGDMRSLKQLLRVKRLGNLDRYGSPDYQTIAAQFRRYHPRQIES